jgi:YHS domain-containing protein
VLDIVFALVFAALFAMTFLRGAKDPMCGMTVDRRAGKPTSVVGGRVFYFCGLGCKARFDAQHGG